MSLLLILFTLKWFLIKHGFKENTTAMKLPHMVYIFFFRKFQTELSGKSIKNEILRYFSASIFSYAPNNHDIKIHNKKKKLYRGYIKINTTSVSSENKNHPVIII